MEKKKKGSFTKKISIAMARGTMVLDENVLGLEPHLKKFNIRTITSDRKLDDADIIEQLAANRILVTNNVKDFKKYASSFDMGIITFEQKLMADLKGLADRISEVIIKHELWSKRHGFIVTIYADGKDKYEELTM